jgi:hypothetical protein
MNDVCQEIAAFTRASERLLAKQATLTENERDLLEYYLNDLSREFLSDKPPIRQCYSETAPIKPAPTPNSTR